MQEAASTYKILVVEGRKPTADRLAPVLDGQGYHVIAARTRRDALARTRDARPVVIVLDSPSLRFSSHRFCKTLRDDRLDIPVLALVPEGEEIDKSIGARAYLRYPLSAKKVINRIERMLPVAEDDVLRVGDVFLNIRQRCAVCGGRESHLTPKQAHLLETLMRHPGEVLSRAFLMKRVWKTDYMGDTRTLDVHIHWVRKAIEEDHSSPVYLRTVRGVGYYFDVPDKDKE